MRVPGRASSATWTIKHLPEAGTPLDRTDLCRPRCLAGWLPRLVPLCPILLDCSAALPARDHLQHAPKTRGPASSDRLRTSNTTRHHLRGFFGRPRPLRKTDRLLQASVRKTLKNPHKTPSTQAFLGTCLQHLQSACQRGNLHTVLTCDMPIMRQQLQTCSHNFAEHPAKFIQGCFQHLAELDLRPLTIKDPL